jgi:hypothetical protein
MKLDPRAIEAAVDEIHCNKCYGYDYSSEEAAEATISAYCKAAGVVIVPVEPTPEMNSAGFMAMLNKGKRAIPEIYRAMIKAAQKE